MAEKRRKRGVLEVRERDGVWWVKVPAIGRKSLGLRVDEVSKDEAYRQACQRYASGALEAPSSKAAQVSSLEELAEIYVRDYQHLWSGRQPENVSYRLGAFVEAMREHGVTRITQITTSVLAKYVTARMEDGIEAATINRTIQVVRPMARRLAKQTPPLCAAGALGSWKNLKEIIREQDPIIPSPAEWGMVIRELEREPSPRATPEGERRTRENNRGIALVVTLAVQSGLRIDELRHTRLSVDLGPDWIAVKAYEGFTPKDREERTVLLPPAVADLAREMVRWRERAVGINGRRIVLGEHWIAKRLAAAWKRAKLPGAAPGMHDARRTFATELSRRPGVGPHDIQRLLGHEDLETTQRYLGRYRSDEARVAIDLGVAAHLRPAWTVP